MAKNTKGKRIWVAAGIALVLVAAAAAVAVYLLPGGQKDGQHVSRDQSFRYENESVYAVFAPEEGTYELSIEGQRPAELSLQVNGLSVDSGAGKVVQAALHKGVNSVSLTDEADGITGITVKNCPALPEYGAMVAYTSYEAEDCDTNAEVCGGGRDYRTFGSEASGRKYVDLDAFGEYVTVKLTAPADTLVIRYCVPDSEDGAGLTGTVDLLVDGEARELTLTSDTSWVYGLYPWNNDPASEAGGHRFFDDVRVVLDQVYPEGTEITIRKGDDFAYCLIDLIEAEERPAPISMPENALSVEDFGAAPNDGIDDSWALMDCMKAAAEQGKEVWIPAGEFEIREHPYAQGIPIRTDNVTIRGAGMWHTILRGDAAGFQVQAANVSFYDFSLIGSVKQRRDSLDPCAIDMVTPKVGMGNIRLQNVWIEHYKVGLWSDVVEGISMMGCRIRNTFADGVNLCAGTSHCVLIHNDLRNTGDDGIAMFNRGVLDVDNKVLYNTVALPWLANNIALYGGKDIVVAHNLLKDTICFGGGVNISTRFTPQIFEGTILVENNKFERCGSWENDISREYGAVWVNTIEEYDNTADCIIRNNVMEDSTYQAVAFTGGGLLENMRIEDNTFAGCGSFAVGVFPEVKGSVTIRNNKITDVPVGEMSNQAEGSFTILN